MKGTIAITVRGHASNEQVSEWKQGIEDIFKPQNSGGGGSPNRFFYYYLCDSISTDQIKALVTKFGGVVVRKAAVDDSVERALLGEYGSCIFEIPDEGEAWRLEAPPRTFQDDHVIMPNLMDELSLPSDDHTHVVLVPNSGGIVVVSTFHCDPSPQSQVPPIPTTFDEAVNTFLELLTPEQRKQFAEIPREQVALETHLTMGMGIRNGWQLWDKDSPLMQQFPGKEADDVSSLVIDAVWEKLQGSPLEPRDAHAWYGKGNDFVGLGRNEDAIRCYDKALQLDRQNVGVWTDKGVALRRLGRYSDAISCLDRALALDPLHVNAWYNKGVSLGNLSRQEDAILCYDKALQLNHQFAPAWRSKADSLLSLGRHEDAIRCYDKALELEPDNVHDWYNRALEEEKIGHSVEAVSSYEQFLKLAPERTIAYQINYARYRIRVLSGK